MAAPHSAIERLPFALPEFTRHCWVNETARQIWEPRLERISHAWQELEWLSVVAEIRSCGIVWLPSAALPGVVSKWRSNHLSAVNLQVEDAAVRSSHAGLIRVVVGNLEDVIKFKSVWESRSHDSVGQLLGYPVCCREFFHRVWVAENCIDTTWFMAASTNDCSDSTLEVETTISNVPNILWRWLGVRAVPHLPCRFDCSASIEFGEKFLALGQSSGYGEEMGWVREILSWPAEWSGLHGIAEIKTPILKLSTHTDATARKYVVRWKGTDYPSQGAAGLRFPFQVPKRPVMTQLKAFQNGLGHPISKGDVKPLWYHSDNGFRSEETMRRLHEPIVNLARKELMGVQGNVLDLGCGNGVLLSKICDGKRLIPFGVDTNKSALEHARELLPEFASNFTEGDLFACETWDRSPAYAMTLLMFGRLKEATRSQAERLIDVLRSKSQRVLVYLYPDWTEQTLAETAQSLGVQLEELPGGNVGLLAQH